MNEIISIDLASLQSIQLGEWTLYGIEDDDSCSLVMRSNNKLFRNDRM